MDEKKIEEIKERMVQALKIANECRKEAGINESLTGREVGIAAVAVKIYDELK